MCGGASRFVTSIAAVPSYAHEPKRRRGLGPRPDGAHPPSVHPLRQALPSRRRRAAFAELAASKPGWHWMNKPLDAAVLVHIQRLASEEHRLLERGELGFEQSRRLAALQTELDQCWDLLRQRRALREFGGDPSQARARDADVVKTYLG